MGRDEDAEQEAICDAKWRAFCDFVKNPVAYCADPREPWDIPTVAPKPKLKPTRKRVHKLTVAQAVKQVAKAGVTPVAATIKPDGSVSLIFPHSDGDNPPTDQTGGKNEWDSVLQ